MPEKTPTLLKDELDAEIRSVEHRSKIKRVVLVVCLIIFLGTLCINFALRGVDGKREVVEMNNDPSDGLEESLEGEEASGGPAAQESEFLPIDSSGPVSSSPSSPVPTPQSSQPAVDRADFFSSGRQIVGKYDQIVGLVTFTASMTDDSKASRIQQAIALDRQYFSRVSDLRGKLVWAGVDSGPYMEAVEAVESGASKISVGLTFMQYWVDDRARASDLEVGLAGVGQGSHMLTQASRQLNSL